jgi:phosphoglucomutase
MAADPRAGQLAERTRLVNGPRFVTAYYALKVGKTVVSSSVIDRVAGTEEVYKIYAEGFRGQDHLRRIQEEARQILQSVFAAAGV